MVMTQTSTKAHAMSDHLPTPETAPDLFEGVLMRRIFAFGIDMAIVGVIVVATMIVGLIAGIFTFGVALLALPFAIVGMIVAYYAVTLGSHNRATLGMQAMDIVLTPTRGQPLNGVLAFVHTLVFWVTIWISWPISLAIALFTPRQQMIHDLVVGTLMVRRSPMDRHWRSQQAGSTAW